jgi:MauM/NapG family ferredoxin protein
MMRTFRRTVQILSLLFFCYLMVTTRPRIEDEFYRVESPIWPYLYFTTNPLTYVSAVTASRTIPAVNYLPLLVMVGLVLLLGRFFCGWLCPLGVMIDGMAHVWRPPKKPTPSSWIPSAYLKVYILIGIIILALFGVNVVGFFDPITIAMRGVSLAVQPYVEWVVRSVLGPLYQVRGVSGVTEPVFGFLKKYYLTLQQPKYEFSLLYLAILLGIFGLSKIRKRFWCRYLCPLGAFHAILGRFGLWRRRVSPACNECGVCGHVCRTEAIDRKDAVLYDPRECIRCMDCEVVCPQDAIEFSFIRSTRSVRVSNRELAVTRRGLLTAVGASFVALPFLRATAHSGASRMRLLRPPGAVREEQFLARCIRCGECMRACPQHALQPALLQFGLEEMWTPVLTPRIGYCEYNCTLCMQVCPTGALEILTQRAKQRFRIGTAFFDKDRCIPWAENDNCLVCEEVCPTPTKAIQMRTEELPDDNGIMRPIKRPFIVEALCVGCGICETKCPVEGSAILVAARHETRNPETALAVSVHSFGRNEAGVTKAADRATTTAS